MAETYDTIVTISSESTEQEFEVSIEYEYSPACRGLRDSYGLQMEPDEPASVEIIAAKGRRLFFDAAKIRHVPVGPELDFLPFLDVERFQSIILEDFEERAHSGDF